MMGKPWFGIWISESIPYGLASKNMKDVRLLEKLMVVKWYKDKYLPNEDGGTSPRNQVHKEFLYTKLEIFLRSKCTINIYNPFLINHDNAIRILTEEGDNIWGENVREESNELKNDDEDIILPVNNRGQQVQQGVQLTSNCTGSGPNESCTSTFFVVKYLDHQGVKMQHTKQLNTRNIHSNQHTKKD